MSNDILSATQLASEWGVTKTTIYGCTRRRRADKGLPTLRSFRLGKQLRFVRADVDEFLRAVRGVHPLANGSFRYPALHAPNGHF